MSEEEVEQLAIEANKLGLSVSSYIRYLIHKEEKK
jgi:hypothetical protein